MTQLLFRARKSQLPVAPAVESSPAMESSAAVETASAVAVKAATRVAATEAASDEAARGNASVTVSWPIAIARTVVAESRAAIKAAPVVAAIPGACANEHAAYKVARAVIAIRRTGIRIVAVVTVGADRRCSNTRVDGTYSNAYRNLCLRVSCGKKHNRQKCNIL